MSVSLVNFLKRVLDFHEECQLASGNPVCDSQHIYQFPVNPTRGDLKNCISSLEKNDGKKVPAEKKDL